MFELAAIVSGLLLLAFAVQAAADAARPTPDPRVDRIPYRQTPQVELDLLVYRPADLRDDDRRPAAVLFHGGGWNRGSNAQFVPLAEDLAARGVVVILPAYRVSERDGTTPYDAVQDAFAAMRYVRANAAALHVDPARIAAGGSSAGGHLAAALATLTADFTRDAADPHADTDASPQALILLNPVYDNGPDDGYGHNRVQDRWREMSPMHNLHAGMPPTLVLCGTNDPLIPVATLERWRDRQRELGVRSELILFEGGKHGFHLPTYEGGANFERVKQEVAAFLASLGYVNGRDRSPRIPDGSV